MPRPSTSGGGSSGLTVGKTHRIANPFAPQNKAPQDIKQVWFAGVHADVGGGYKEECGGLSKYPLTG